MSFKPKHGKIKNLLDKTERRDSRYYGRSCQTRVDLGAFVLKGGNDRLVHRRLIKNETPERPPRSLRG